MRETLSRAAVVAAARDLLVRAGLSGLSLRRLAASLDVTAAALYAYVDSKRDLLEAVIEKELEALIAEFEAVGDANPVEQMCRMSWAYVRYAERNPTVFQTMFMFRAQLSPKDPAGSDFAMAAKAFNSARAPLIAAMDQGLVRRGDLSLTHLTLWTAVHGAASVLLLDPNLEPQASLPLARMVIDTVVRGLCTPEGIAVLDRVCLPED